MVGSAWVVFTKFVWCQQVETYFFGSFVDHVGWLEMRMESKGSSYASKNYDNGLS